MHGVRGVRCGGWTRDTGAARQPAGLLRRRGPRDRHRRAGDRVVRRPDLRAPRGGAQPPRGGSVALARSGVRGGAPRGPRGRHRDLLGARRIARGGGGGPRAAAHRLQRNLSAGDQGAHGGAALRARGARRDPDRARRAPGGRGHDGPLRHILRRPHAPRADARRRRRPRGARPRAPRLRHPDHALDGRYGGDRRDAAAAVPGARHAAPRGHLLRHPEPPGRGQEAPRALRRAAGRRLAQQLQLQPPARARRSRRRPRLPDRRSAGPARRRRDRRGLGARGAGAAGPRAARPMGRRDTARGRRPRGAHVLCAAARAAARVGRARVAETSRCAQAQAPDCPCRREPGLRSRPIHFRSAGNPHALRRHSLADTRPGELHMRNLQWVASALSLILTACGGGYGGGGGGSGGGMGCGGAYQPVCPAPMVTLTAPAAGAMESGTIALTATASASTAYGITVSKVDFLIDGALVGTATTSPYTVMWNSTTVTAGTHLVTGKVTDSANDTATTPPVSFTTTGHAALTVTMTSAQILPTPSSSASGTAHITVKLETGAMRGTVMLSGLTATAVTINDGFAGATGPRVITLVANGGTAGQWDVPAGALLTQEQLTALQQGKLYVIATSVANPRGEIRGQIVPDNIVVTFSRMDRTPQVAALGLAAGGVAATTVDTSANTLTIHVNSTGVDDAMAAQVATGAAGSSGPKLIALTKDAVDMGHWSAELVSISAADVGDFEAGGWFVNVATPTEPNGAIGARIE